ncbi:hypothetical protein B484DRAFT_404035, partial [Ochromonadaceae sp. CCMP2298]
FELFVALILFYMYTSSKQYWGLTWSLWLAGISFLFGPFWFNPLSFEWNRIKDDYVMWMYWMSEVGGGSEQSWEAWWKEENRFYGTLSPSWKLFLAIQRGAPWVLLSVGLAGDNFMTSTDEQGRVIGLLAILFAFLFGNWVIQKLERYWTYAVRRFASLSLWTLTGAAFIGLFATHIQYVKYTVALYYLGSAVAFLALLLGCTAQVQVVYKVHDYLVGHSIFLIISLLALLQMGYFQTWLLYHNALSSGVEIEDILRFARKTKQQASDSSDVVTDLRSQIAEQQRVIKQILEREQQGQG